MEHAVEADKQLDRLGVGPRQGSASPVESTMHPVLQLQRQAGNQAVQRAVKSGADASWRCAGDQLSRQMDLPYERSAVQHLQRNAGNQTGRSAFGVHGITGHSPAPMAFPHGDRVLRALGVNGPLTSVRDILGCEKRGTPAFTDGLITHFAAETPELHVAAHEAAHQLQHAGVTRDAGLGPEGHAGAVADAVREGWPAVVLIGNRGAPVSSARRNYTLTDGVGQWKGVSPGAVFAKLADTGEVWVRGGHTAYATPGLITLANNTLQARQSGITISPGAEVMTVEAPNGAGSKSLSSADTKFAIDPKGEKFYGDCRQAAREVMGSKGSDIPEDAVCSPGGHSTVVAAKPLDLVAKVVFLDQRIRDTPNYDQMTPDQRREVAQKASEDFDNLTAEEKDKVRKSPITVERLQQMGIDQYAEPGVGEAFAVFPSDKAPTDEFHFHYAAVIIVTGSDRVTLENAGGDPGEITKNWFMQMYGPESKHQTFQEEERAILGQDVHTLRVSTWAPQPADIGSFASMPTRELIRRLQNSTNASEQTYLKTELDHRNIMAWVEVQKKMSWVGDDDVYVWVGGDTLGRSTGSVSVEEGQSNVFRMPMMNVWPVSDPLVIAVHQWSLLRGDHLIGSVTWPAPYLPQHTAELTSGGAKYTLQVAM